MSEEIKEVRLDKWLWAVRIFKTRTIATEACKKNRVAVNNTEAKPSKLIKIGDKINVRRPPVTYTFEVLDITEKRMGAKLVPEFLKNITPPEALEILQIERLSGFKNRARGEGRPTKKDRRELDVFSESSLIDLDEWDWDTLDNLDEEEISDN